MKKFIAFLLTIFALFDFGVMPVHAEVHSEDPLAVKDFKEFGTAMEEITTPEDVPDLLPQEQEALIIPEGEPAEEKEPTPELQDTVAETTATERTPIEEDAKGSDGDETVDAQAEVKETEPTGTDESEVGEDPDTPRGHNGVPLYFQNDYPNNVYGMGTIETNGCSAASLAMVATYLTGHEYLPDEIARYFGGAAENNIARLEHGSEMMRLPYWKAENWHEMLDAIKQGKIAIVLVDSGSVFTKSQHFIIVTGMTEDGKMLVNDSWKPNYDKWDCKEGLINGFDPSAILAGWSGAWIYDKNKMPKDPFLYSEPEPVRGEPRYGIELTWEQMKLMAKVVWVESRGECKEGQQAVAEVILNRLTSDEFPDNLHDVIYGEGQFRSAKFLDKAEPYQLQYEAIENALYGPYVLPQDVYYFATTPMTSKKWGRIGGHIFCYADD